MTWLHHIWNWWLFHPMREGTGSTCSATDHSGCGYAGWSGWMGSVFWTIAAFSLGYAKAKNCHVQRCWRMSWHPHPEHGHPVCKAHHPHGRRGVLHRLIHRSRRDPGHVLAPEAHS